MKYCIDIDKTICVLDYFSTDNTSLYKNAKPINQRIENINQLYRDGHTIIYWTVRDEETKEITQNQLKSWNCLYHTLIFNKPAYDVFIDDKSFNVNHIWPIIINGDTSIVKKGNTLSVQKKWGYETCIINNKDYCGRTLSFNKKSKLSMVHLMKKIETWYVVSGVFLFIWVSSSNSKIMEETLHQGDMIRNFLGDSYKVVCLEEGTIFEIYNKDF